MKSGDVFSRGVDSLSGLRYNRLNYPMNHPASIKDALFIYGQNFDSDPRFETFEKAVEDLSQVADETGVTIVPVYTNIRRLDEEGQFFADQFHGSVLGAVAHTFVKRLGIVFISATDDIPSLVLQGKGMKSCKPWGYIHCWIRILAVPTFESVMTLSIYLCLKRRRSLPVGI